MDGLKQFFLGIGAVFASLFTQGQQSVNNIENNVFQSPVIHISQAPVQAKISGSITPTGTPAPTVIPTPKPGYSLSDFVYPGATQGKTTGTVLQLTSTDDPQKIFNWYEDKINNLKVAKNSTVNSSTNGSVNAHIDAANYSAHIVIDITKHESDQNTSMIITVTPLTNAEANIPDSDTTVIQGSTVTKTTIINTVNSSTN